jgi:hypothetical protein
MKRPRLFFASLIAAAAVTVLALLLPAEPVDALPGFLCLAERTTPIVSGQGATCSAAQQDAEAEAAALMICADDTCFEQFEVTQSCLGVFVCNGSCHSYKVVAGRMRYRCRVDI